jgi:adenylate cyclase
VGLFVLDPPILHAIELNWFDLRFQTRGPVKPEPTVVLAVVDEKSIASEGRWPWPRSRIAELIDALSDDGAKVIGFDITFSEPDENSRLAIVNQIERTIDTLEIKNPKLVDFLRETRVEADTDRALVTALERSKAAVVLGYFFHMDQEAAGKWLAKQEVEVLQRAIEDSKYPMVEFRDEQSMRAPLLKAYVPQPNLEMFNKAAPSSGYFSVSSDPDGVVRWMPLVVQSGEELYPPLALVSVWQYLGKPPLSVQIGPTGVEGVRLGDNFIETDAWGRMLVNYRGPPYMFAHHSVSDILAGRVRRGTFKDKIVLVGVTALGVYDIRATPFSPVYPGAEIQATAIDNILRGDAIIRPNWSKTVDLLAILVLGALVALVLPRMSAVGSLVLAGVLFFAYVGLAQWLFASTRVWLNIVYPAFSLAGTYTVLTVYRYLTEERERKRIKETFKHYVAPDVIDIVLGTPGGVRLGGEERVMTALFSDLEGFTAFSEKNSPSELIGILSDYYANMTEQVFASKGTLVEYVGDELFAIFGAPAVQAEHAAQACAAALAMRENRAALSAEWVKIGRPQLKARTGINSGPMLVGNIGSKYRFHYSALGDHVNLASRLEQLNKIYSTEIMVSETTADMVKGQFVLRQLDLVQVKGRQQALRIYELIAKADAPLPDAKRKMLDLYASGFEAYLAQSWDKALGLFAQCLILVPGDGPSRLMEERCRIYRSTPPPEEWNGVFEHHTKG